MTPRRMADHVVRELPIVTRNDVVVWLPYNLMAFSVIPPVLRPTTTAFRAPQLDHKVCVGYPPPLGPDL
jgi:hypothetical protein